jgi:pimeloyl-ACP methyl ester carboxylesterase
MITLNIQYLKRNNQCSYFFRCSIVIEDIECKIEEYFYYTKKGEIYQVKYTCNIIFILSIIVITGCQSDYGVNKTGMEEWVRARSITALDSDHLSQNTVDFLLREGLFDEYENSPEKTLKKLSRTLIKTKDRNLLYTLIELTYLEAKNCTDEDRAAFYYLSACIYSYAYLFNKDFNKRPSPYEPEFLFAGRFYNYSATEVFQYLQKRDLLNSSDVNLPFLNGFVKLIPPKNTLPYKLKTFSSIEVCYNYTTFGFHSLSRQSGLGVPLIASGRNIFEDKKKKNEIREISKVAYPATAFLRFLSSEKGKYNLEIDLYDPMNTHTISVKGKEIPLEVDLSTYLAWVLRGGEKYSPVYAMMNTKSMENHEGLYTLTPYDKNKIPVVFVHGVLSYPRTWVQTINTLLMDPKIREKYQFWLFAYPSGNPVLYSALELREDLIQARKKFDPKGDNPNFNDMVLIGHSMGGLLVKSMVQNTGNQLLNALTDGKPLEDFNLTKEEEDFMKKMLIYKRLPFVDRVIFISVPHRGSTMTRWWVANLAAKLINLPKNLASEISKINHKILVKTGIKPEENNLDVTTGVDNLDPANRFVKLSSKMPIDKHVKYHSIMGNNEKSGVPGGTDGIVEYSSSHLDGAVSELIIKSGHSAHEKPLAIKEIKRILLQHLKEQK